MARRKKGEIVNGWVCLDKGYEMGSTDAVTKVRRLFDAQKAGHAGTLDPLATGVLPIALGEATKTVPFMMDAEKVYRFTIHWGISTDSIDREGEITARSDVRPSVEAVKAALPSFVGDIDQVPPQFSAIRVNGERAYDLARDGAEFELEARKVTIHEAAVTDAPDADHVEITMRTGKGVYVRSLARDLAVMLGAEGMFPLCAASGWGRSRPRTPSLWIFSPIWRIRAPPWKACCPFRPLWTTSRIWP